MDRTLISFNVPNLITIPIMAFLGFLLIATVWQLAQRAAPGLAARAANATGGGY